MIRRTKSAAKRKYDRRRNRRGEMKQKQRMKNVTKYDEENEGKSQSGRTKHLVRQ